MAATSLRARARHFQPIESAGCSIFYKVRTFQEPIARKGDFVVFCRMNECGIVADTDCNKSGATPDSRRRSTLPPEDLLDAQQDKIFATFFLRRLRIVRLSFPSALTHLFY